MNYEDKLKLAQTMAAVPRKNCRKYDYQVGEKYARTHS